MTSSRKSQSAPRQSVSRRLPTGGETRIAYHRYGVHPPTTTDIGVLESFANRFQSTMPSPANVYYRAWLQYELGLAKQSYDKRAASRHYSSAIKQMSEKEMRTAEDLVDVHKNIAQFTLLHARLDRNERHYGLQRRATIAELGRIAVHTADTLQKLDGNSNQTLRMGLRGQLTEVAMAGVLLTMMHNGRELITAPASPRQNSPHRKNRVDYASSVAHIQKIDSLDINVLFYDGPDFEASSIVPVQVKTVIKSDDDPERYSNLVLYGDRDLFAESFREYKGIGEDLVQFGCEGTSNRQLSIAQSNVGFAFELYSETAQESVS
jgi:hypothetical protein